MFCCEQVGGYYFTAISYTVPENKILQRQVFSFIKGENDRVQ